MQWGLLVKFSYNPHCKIVSLELCWSKQTTSAVLVSSCYNTLILEQILVVSLYTFILAYSKAITVTKIF